MITNDFDNDRHSVRLAVGIFKQAGRVDVCFDKKPAAMFWIVSPTKRGWNTENAFSRYMTLARLIKSLMSLKLDQARTV